MTDEQVNLLKQFVQLCKANPAVLHQPQFAFYREYLESLGAKIPSCDFSKNETSKDQPKRSFEEYQEEEEKQLPLPELDNSGVIEDKTCGEEYAMGDPNKKVSDEDMEKAQEHRQAAQIAFSEGNYEKSLEEYTKAIEFNPGLAILHAKRASTLLKMSKLTAAIKDCDKAIAINPDSAAAYKFRGRAQRLLGNWVEAHLDLALSCRLDYDDEANEWMREVEPNAKKLHDYQRAKERIADDKEMSARKERVRRAQEEHKRAADESGDVPPGIDINKIMEEIKKDPSKIGKYLNDPNVLNVLGMMGGKGGGFDPSTFNMPTGDFDNSNTSKQEPRKAPEPDLD